MNVRIIPRLDIKGPNLVKGIHFEGLRVLGKPEHYARFYYESGADELYYQDAVASLYGRNSLLEIIRKTSKEIFIPLCVGGGLRSIDDIREVLRAGADKVAINTSVIHDPNLIAKASRVFGSSTIVVAIEAVRNGDSKYECCIDYGRELTGLDAIGWAAKAVDLGAGELLVTSIDREGTGEGYDLDLIRNIAELVPVPVIAGGGCGKIDHVSEVIKSGKADAVCMASILHYTILENGQLGCTENDFETEGNTVFLNSKKSFTKVGNGTLREIKERMSELGISCRMD
ncbi:imidazole glycerol phosphate synthase subunit HisF [Thermodesulfobacteriota bacterium]